MPSSPSALPTHPYPTENTAEGSNLRTREILSIMVRVRRVRWTYSEDALMNQLKGKGEPWKVISSLLPCRSIHSCKTRYYHYVRRRGPGRGTNGVCWWQVPQTADSSGSNFLINKQFENNSNCNIGTQAWGKRSLLDGRSKNRRPSGNSFLNLKAILVVI